MKAYEKYKTIIWGAVLFVSICLNLFQWSVISAPPPEPPAIVGTYCSNIDLPPISPRLVFTRGGNYCFYLPHNMMEEGTYRLSAEDIYRLVPTDPKIDEKQILLQQDMLYLFENGGEITKLPKMYDIPIYDSVKPSFEEYLIDVPASNTDED